MIFCGCVYVRRSVQSDSGIFHSYANLIRSVVIQGYRTLVGDTI
jgi:hypothetical protein